MQLTPQQTLVLRFLGIFISVFFTIAWSEQQAGNEYLVIVFAIALAIAVRAMM